MYEIRESDQWHWFTGNRFRSVSMIFGSFIARASSEGSGAAAFPEMIPVAINDQETRVLYRWHCGDCIQALQPW